MRKITKEQIKKRLRYYSVCLSDPKLKPEILAKLLALLDKYDSLSEHNNQHNLNWLMLSNSKFRSQVLNIIKTKKR